MTPSTSLSLQGFLQGLHNNMVGLIGSILTLVVVLLFVHWVISRFARTDDCSSEHVKSARKWANCGIGTIALLVLIGFGMNAASYATNLIPRTTLDRSSINSDMDKNIQR